MLRKKLENTANNMKADRGRIRLINELSSKLLTERSEITDEVSQHLQMLKNRWENLQELVSARRGILEKAGNVHEFRKDSDDISDRMREKVRLLCYVF